MGDDTYYRSDIDVRLTSQDDTCYKKTTYVVTGTATGAGKIGNVSISSGQVVNISETEIANGGTFKIQADGRWTVKGYTYDKAGRKSVIANGITITRDTVNPVANTPSVTSGTQGEAGYYRSNVTVKISGSDATSPLKKVTYRVTGTAKGANGKGTVANTTVTENQTIDTGEVEIANNGTIQIQADGVWTITSYSYDKSGRKSAVSGSLVFTRDTVKPTISSFTRTARTGTTINVSVSASDAFSGIGTTSSTYTYYQASTSKGTSKSNTFQYTGLTDLTNYTFKVTVKDKAGNVSDEKTLTTITAGTKNFDYTGGIQTFTAPDTGTYKLEVWGASGGQGYAGGPGMGGNATGQVSLDIGNVLYVVVGGKGGDRGASTGGYNGGGKGAAYRAGGAGGGATHIARSEGVLANLENKKTDIYIVAGGGGGGPGGNRSNGDGGTGGGIQGGQGSTYCGNDLGGSQTQGGVSYNGNAGRFGCGGDGGNYYGTGGGGGGGLYGGAGGSCYYQSSNNYYYGNGGAGGSGYIGGVTNGSMSNGVNSGNGRASITLVE